MSLASLFRPCLSQLPDELLLAILAHLQPYDLWFCARRLSRRFLHISQEVLMHKCFECYTVQFSWCCAWCTLGPQHSQAILNDIAPLFKHSQLNESGDKCDIPVMDINITCFCEQFGWTRKFYFRIGSESVKLRVKDLHRLGIKTDDLRRDRRRFLAYYFSEMKKTKQRWAMISTISDFGHQISLLLPLCACMGLIGIAAVIALSYCIVRALLWVLKWPFRALGSSYRGLIGQ